MDVFTACRSGGVPTQRPARTYTQTQRDLTGESSEHRPALLPGHATKLRLPLILHPLHEPLFKVIHEFAYLGGEMALLGVQGPDGGVGWLVLGEEGAQGAAAQMFVNVVIG